MASFKETFPNKHTLLPVIHVETFRQTLRNTELAQDEGADGVFLISMNGMHHKELSQIQHTAKIEFSDFWIGVNFLDIGRTVSVFSALNYKIDGVWTDDAGIVEGAERQIEAMMIDAARRDSKWDGLYFGGVSFKYRQKVNDHALVAKVATEFMDVVTTSGDETGKPPEPEKIIAMKAAIGEKPLGIASGISSENVQNYKGADVFLVATSLLRGDSQEFDKYKMRDLVSAVRGK